MQRDCQPSALNCFVEAMSQCVPPIPIRPCVLKYLGKTHNLWFRSTLMLEHQAFEKGLSLQIKPKQTTEFYEQESITPPQQVVLYLLKYLMKYEEGNLTLSSPPLSPGVTFYMYFKYLQGQTFFIIPDLNLPWYNFEAVSSCPIVLLTC